MLLAAEDGDARGSTRTVSHVQNLHGEPPTTVKLAAEDGGARGSTRMASHVQNLQWEPPTTVLLAAEDGGVCVETQLHTPILMETAGCCVAVVLLPRAHIRKGSGVPAMKRAASSACSAP